MKKILHSIGSVIAAFVRSCPRIALQPSLYPELPRKSFWRRYFECLYLRFRDGAVCMEYTSAGLDVKGRCISEYITEAFRCKYIQSDAEVDLATKAAVLFDKDLFSIYFSEFKIPVVQTLLRFTYSGGMVPELRMAIKKLGVAFLKCTAGWCGQLVWKICVNAMGEFECNGTVVEIESLLEVGASYLLQPVVVNHPKLDGLNSSCLNTLRLMTYIDPNSHEIKMWDDGFLRIGNGKAVDNFWAGGVVIPIEHGRLKKFGFTNDSVHKGQMKRVVKSPSTGIEFSGFEIPYYDEAVDVCLKAHRFLPRIKSVGWDVGVTKDGPVLIEGNHDWGNDIVQVVKAKGDMKIYLKAYGR